MFSDPQKIVEQCGIQAGQVIADFGSGSGHYSLALAKALGATGRVYAIDVQKDLLTRLQSEARKQNVSNIDVIWGDVEKEGGTKLKAGCVDLVVLGNLLFQLEDKKSAVTEIKRVLVPGGRILVVDWEGSFGGIGPRADQVVNKVMALALFEGAGFSKEREVQAGSHHYGFIFKKL